MNIVKYLLLICPFFSIAQGGENIFISGVYKVEAYYKGARIVDDSCILNVSKSYSYFYSLGIQESYEKSLKEFEKTKEFSNKFTCKVCFPYTIFKDYKKNKVFKVQQLKAVFYAYDQPSINNINWTLTKDSLAISGINCFKAIGKLDTVTYTAFYAPSIPISDGPSILVGLPGLILKSESSNGLKIELLSLKYLTDLTVENKFSRSFQFTTYEQFKAAETAMIEALQSGKEVELGNGTTIRRTN